MAFKFKIRVIKRIETERRQCLTTLRHPGSQRSRVPQTVTWVLLTSSWLRHYRLIPPPAPTLPSKVHCLWIPALVVRVTSISSGMAVVGPTVGGSGHEQAGAVEVLRESRPVVVARTCKGTAIVDVGVASGVCDCGAVDARGSSGSRVRDRCLSSELGFRMSLFNGSSWVSFSSQLSRPSESKSESPAGPSEQFDHDEQHYHPESEERVVHTSEGHESQWESSVGSAFPCLGGRGQNFQERRCLRWQRKQAKRFTPVVVG